MAVSYIKALILLTFILMCMTLFFSRMSYETPTPTFLKAYPDVSEINKCRLILNELEASEYDGNGYSIRCYNKGAVMRIATRGEYWVLYNYITASRTFHCNETITYTTHGDFTFLGNLKPLLERWRGPVSVAIHAPGDDFHSSLRAIRYAQQCESPLVGELVTFHLFCGHQYLPPSVPSPASVLAWPVDCSAPAPWLNVSSGALFKSKKQLRYPVNVARNIARESAVTHFVFPSDIELYPSPGLIALFLDMVQRPDPHLLTPGYRVFPLPVFEVEHNARIPDTKTELVSMLKNRSAIPFHQGICSACHGIPASREWQDAPETQGLSVFHVGKRTGAQKNWEPFFIGTHSDPPYEERQSWEGMSDKMTQAYIMCVLNYDFLIPDNAFLVHRPGIKRSTRNPQRNKIVSETAALLRKEIMPELGAIYGKRQGCTL